MLSELLVPGGIALAGILFVSFLAWKAFPRKVMTSDVDGMRAAARRTRSDAAAMHALYLRARAAGMARSEALKIAAEQFGRAERVTTALPPLPKGRFKLPKPKPADAIRAAQSVLVNAVTAIGVYRLDWPVGTGLALYWAENVMTGLIVIVTVAIWRKLHEDEPGQPYTSTGDVATIAIAFSIGHLIFLIACLAMILPRVSAAEKFDIHSFLAGAAVIGILLLFDFAVALLRLRNQNAEQVERSIALFLQRVAVLHLTIIFGMFAMAIVGHVRALFAVFTALKIVADMTRKME